jgi:ATP-dependent DNA helicase RecG
LASIPVSRLKGVGEKKTKALSEIGIETVFDILTYYPRRYVDRTRQVALSQLAVGEEALVLARVRRCQLRRTRNGRTLVEVDAFDGTGYLHVVFFNQPWRSKQLQEGTEAAFFGKLECFRNIEQMSNPIVDLIGDRTGRIVPIYPQSEKAGIPTWEIAKYVDDALSRAGDIFDPIPEDFLDKLDLIDRNSAIHLIHKPSSLTEMAAARKRLAFDELLRLQLMLVQSKVETALSSKGISHDVIPIFGNQTHTSRLNSGLFQPPEPQTARNGTDLVQRFFASLPFDLTNAQKRALDEIANDMRSPIPMHRLLQGDVGSGKTLVALGMLLMAVQGGYQGALMAPTEVLAEQHMLALTRLLKGFKAPGSSDLGLFAGEERELRVELLTGKVPAARRKKLLDDLYSGAIDIVVGTHALISEAVEFRNLGAVVIDEQHRFGVEQRAILRERSRSGHGLDPDMLIMTATPIPRTAAMTVFGDLDLTILDEMPPGRTPILTRWAKNQEQYQLVFDRVRDEISKGRQVYVVCPLVEGSERVVAKSATEEYQRLSQTELKGLKVGLLHGQMQPGEKEEVMDRFRNQQIDALVSTTVIEVGVDVPNATVMVIEDADRFGIAQLHQLRGRVGRGKFKSYCYLISFVDSEETNERLEALVKSTDGFYLAEKDLELRGEGTILGRRQKGRSDLKLASLAKDRDLVALAQVVAKEIVGGDPSLNQFPQLAHELEAFIGPDDTEFLFLN